MASSMSVGVQMEKLLDEFSKEVQQAMDDSITKVSKESAQKLKSTSPKKTGHYARGWRVKKEGKNGAIVHNATDYQLTHLLENGHVIRNKSGTYGRVRPIKHIKPVEEWANNELPAEIERRIK